MTNPARTVIALVLDRSSSLSPIRDDLRAGLTGLLDEQREHGGELLVAVARTGDRRSPTLRPAERVRIPRLAGRRTAAVRDAVGTLTTELGTLLAAMPEDERPGRVLVLTVRGLVDERSATWGPDELRDRVDAQERDYAWEFVTITIGEHASLAPWGTGHRSIGVAPTGPTVRAALAAASAYLLRARAVGPWEPVAGFSEEERVAAYPPVTVAVDHDAPVDEALTEAIPVVTAELMAEEDRAAHARWWNRLLPSRSVNA